MADDEDRTIPADITALLQTGRPRTALRARRPEITLHQLRIFWAVAHSETLTRAAKQLGLAQPSLSQQLSKLETTVGTRLFRRHSNEMTLTEAGTYLLPRAEQILRNMQDLEDGLGQFSGGHRVTVRLAGINSVLRVVLPAALASTQAKFPDIDFDIQESAPADILEMLYGRRVNVGLLAANSVAEASVGFQQIPIIEDPYVLVVPETLSLDDITDPRQLAPPDWAMLNRSIQFIFGTQHAKRVADWYDQMLPEHRVVAQCRSFEVAIGLVRAGSGICLAPTLSTVSGSASLDGVRLYRINADTRRIVALVASQYRGQEPYASLIDALQAAGEALALPGIRPTPPFLDCASRSEF
ncbi:LysR family transcriptional regulator [Devosia insulae]|uniref:LysR family transcriptional regulator n=1 Tax=Devosia insulae TaxID=408174 RepID=UPI000A01BB9C|nr:LysR family transcriptional regulator [Devosia insulae]